MIHDVDFPEMIQAVLDIHLSQYQNIEDVESYIILVRGGCEMHTIAFEKAMHGLIFPAIDNKNCSHLGVLRVQLRHQDARTWEDVWQSNVYVSSTCGGIHLSRNSYINTLEQLWSYIILVICMGSTSCYAAYERQETCRTSLVLGSSFLAALFFLGSIGHYIVGIAGSARSSLSIGVALALLSVVLRNHDAYLLEFMTSIAVCSVAVTLATAYLDPPQWVAVKARPPTLAATVLLLGCAAIALRVYIVSASVRAFHRARRAHCRHTACEAADSDSEALAALEALVAAVAAQCPPPPARQLNRARAALQLGQSGEDVPGTVDQSRPVRNLDQCYSQALGAALLLRRKCAEWAGDAAAVQPVAAGDDAGLQAMLKRPERAIEKAAVCYGGDASRLLDVCRARLLFAGAEDLAACLRTVIADGSGARVVRVRGRLPAPDLLFRVISRSL
jgi:hypothetical protein